MTSICGMQSLKFENAPHLKGWASVAGKKEGEGHSEVFLQIINLRNDIISRISHTEPGSVKLFYKKLRADFNAEVDNVFKKLEELSK